MFGGGHSGSSRLDVIDYITISSAGNATDFGNLTAVREDTAGISSPTRGVFGGGLNTDGNEVNIIEYITIASTGNATDFGDLSASKAYGGSSSNGHGGL